MSRQIVMKCDICHEDILKDEEYFRLFINLIPERGSAINILKRDWGGHKDCFIKELRERTGW